jgi:hypothetical protein
MRHNIAFLHTAWEHVSTFDTLVSELAPRLAVRLEVNVSLLSQASAQQGNNLALQDNVERAMHQTASSGARVVVCTCSTIGAYAEGVGQGHSPITQRIDRAMADAAVAIGSRLLIVAALSSTIEPARQLIGSSAARKGRPVSFHQVVVEDAWYYSERSMLEAYLERIAAVVFAYKEEANAIVLAQASMAKAAAQLGESHKTVLANPRLDFKAGIEAFDRF